MVFAVVYRTIYQTMLRSIVFTAVSAAISITISGACYLVSPLHLQAQPAPIVVQTQVIPPYSPYLSDYVTANDRLLVRLINTSQVARQVRLAGSLRGTNGVEVTIPPTFIPTQPIVVPPGATVQVLSSQLSEYFSSSAVQISGTTLQEVILGNGLPEGSYQLCLQALDFASGQPLSQMAPLGCTPQFAVAQLEPPFLLQPMNETHVPASFPQAIVFSWSVPAGARQNQIEYVLRLAEMFPQNMDPNQGMLAATTPRLFEQVLVNNSYVYGPSDLPLEIGKRYAFQVIARPAPGQNAVFRNGGRSVAFAFTYGTPQQIAEYRDSLRRAKPFVAAGTKSASAVELPQPRIRGTGVEANGVERPVIEVRVEEFLSRKIHPLLNYVFFDSAQFELPSRYVAITPRQSLTYNPRALYNKEPLDVYYHTLNILGYRMKNNPSENITLVGCAGALESPTQGKTALAQSRALSVANYLKNVWGIDAQRIQIQARELPEKPTLSQTKPLIGDEENRRVEILGSWELVQPLIMSDTLREATPPIIRFYNDVQTSPAYKEWSIVASQQDREIKRFRAARAISPYVDWRINRDKNSIPLDTTTVEYQLAINYDTLGSAASEVGRMPVQQVTIQKKRRERVNDVERDRYSIVLFEIGSDVITDNILRTIELIRAEKSIKPTSKVSIIGYTDDVLGSARDNLALAKRRAEAVAKALGVTKEDVQELVVEGSTRSLPYETDLPEARFYCRTVLIEVENPVVLE
jgi:outer membrane protein OmpA-like peptidoglycan-associated protein